MVKLKSLACIFCVFASGAVYADSGAGLGAEGFQAAQQSEFFGSQVGGSVSSGAGAVVGQLQSVVNLNLLGVSLQALLALSSPPNTINGVTYNEVYSFGKAVPYVTGGDGSIAAGIMPTEIRVPALEYPVGPMILELDAGTRFQANFTLQNMSVIGIPASLSSLGLQMQGNLDAAGFVEGYAKLLVVRGGVGGEFDLVNVQANASARINFDGSAPNYFISGMATFLSGQVYAFGDVFNILAGGWARFLSETLYSWSGYCYSVGSLSCPTK